MHVGHSFKSNHSLALTENQRDSDGPILRMAVVVVAVILGLPTALKL